MANLPEAFLQEGGPSIPLPAHFMCKYVIWNIVQEVKCKNINGIKVARGAPIISHLLFADYSFLFARADQREADVILNALRAYQRGLGQLVNIGKSEVSFRSNVQPDCRMSICRQLGFQQVSSHFKYLGIPVVFGRSKKVVFSHVIKMIWKKLKGWKEKALSGAGREILIKFLAQAIPNYIIGCYKIPDGCCNQIEKMLANFWWGAKEG
ncbi:unnamed protein product [Vicia faba]|uniref:Uncharacterized protein n=1 Tax=Vicia faba TaxID=3906 RepID=A0AAV0YX66_VICFA|nr:unnamed protein product [Vicia faba]